MVVGVDGGAGSAGVVGDCAGAGEISHPKSAAAVTTARATRPNVRTSGCYRDGMHSVN